MTAHTLPELRAKMRPARVRRPAALLLFLTLLVTGANAQAMCFVSGSFSEGNPDDPAQARTTLCWNPANPVPAAHDIEHVIWNPDLGEGEYLAVGAGGAILASPDGLDWTPRDSGTTQRLFGGAWDGIGQRYVVVGDGGLVMTSPDGEVWTGQDTNTRARLLDVAVNSAGRYVVVGEEGTVLTSVNATTWIGTTVLSPARRPAMYAVVARGERFVAVGSSTAIISSTDGIEWRVHSYVPLAPPGQPQPVILRDVAVSPGGIYVAVGHDGAIHTSNNGIDWEEQAPPLAIDPKALLRRVIRIDGVGQDFFLAVGNDGDAGTPLLLQSTDNGRNWSNISSSLPGDTTPTTLRTIASDGTGLVTAGNRSLLHSASTTPDWQTIAPAPDLTPDLRDLVTAAFPPDRAHLAVGADGAVLSSPDGLTWSSEDSGTDEPLNGIAARRDGDGIADLVVAVGDNGEIVHSSDGAVWTRVVDSGTEADLTDIAFGDAVFVAVGLDGTILTSADGANWSAPATGSFAADFHGVAFGEIGGTAGFVAVGSDGTVVTSVDDGANWNAVEDADLTGTLRAVIWKGDDPAPRFVAVGETAAATPTAAAFYSPDGADWIVAGIPTPSPAPPLRAVAWNGRQFIAASDGDLFLRSTSGQGWTTIGNTAAEVIPRIDALAWTGDRFLAAGAGGRIAGSGDVDLAVDIDTDVSIDPDDTPFFGRAGIDKTYRFTVSNIGHLDATGVTFTYTPPPGISDLAANAPANWPCTAPDDRTGLTCTSGRLVAGADDAVVIGITMTLPAQSNITIDHEVAVSTDPADAQPANNTLTVTTLIGPQPPPGLPSPDVDFGSSGALGPLGLLLLALTGVLLRALTGRTAPSRP